MGIAGVAALAASGVFHADASGGPLPRTTPAALLAAVRSPSASQFSGTVVSHVSLGLPDLPAFSASSGEAPFASLLSGSRTLQVWYGGPQQQRVALLGAMDETDLFHDGRQLWKWSSADRVAERATLPKHLRHSGDDAVAAGPVAPDEASSMTPGELAKSALAALDPSTEVRVRSRGQVADRAAYELVLTPRSSLSRIGAVHIAVDGQTKVPLGVQIFARGASTPAIDVSYTSIHFTPPADTTFRFTPPSGATVRRVAVRNLRDDSRLNPRRVHLFGSDWSTVAGYATGRSVSYRKLGLGNSATTAASGTWGRGRVLETDLISVLVTRDGRVFAGAVDPSALFAAAGQK